MPDSLELYVRNAVARRSWRDQRQVAYEASTKITRIEARADVQAAQVDAVGGIAQRAMQSVAIVSQIEGQLGQVVPLAATRLQAVGDIAALGMAQVVTDTVNKLRQC